MIEDSLAGVVSAKGAGMWAVGVATTYDADSLRRAGADAVIDATGRRDAGVDRVESSKWLVARG